MVESVKFMDSLVKEQLQMMDFVFSKIKCFLLANTVSKDAQSNVYHDDDGSCIYIIDKPHGPTKDMQVKC